MKKLVLIGLILSVVIIESFAQNDTVGFKNEVGVVFQYDRAGLEYHRNIKNFTIRSSVNFQKFEPKNAAFYYQTDTYFSYHQPVIYSLDSIACDTAMYTVSMIKGREIDIRVGVGYKFKLKKIDLVLGVDGVVGQRTLSKRLEEAIAFNVFSSSENENIVIFRRKLLNTSLYKSLKVGIAPTIGVSIPVNRWLIGIAYNPELSWLYRINPDSSETLDYVPKYGRFAMQAQTTLSLAFSF